jgi:hypothetical protein
VPTVAPAFVPAQPHLVADLLHLGGPEGPPAEALPLPYSAAPPVLPVEAPLPPAPAPQPTATPGPRVELGFADGSFRMLDPSSSAAQQLSDLVAQLTSKSDDVTATAS